MLDPLPPNKTRMEINETANPTDEEVKAEHTLTVLAVWLKYHLHEHARHRQTGQSPVFDGYCSVEVPDWDVRQKIALIEGALLAIRKNSA